MKIEVEKYVEMLQTKNYSECTRKLYQSGIEDYIRHGFDSISIQEERVYIEMLKKEGKKARTVNARIYALNSYNKWVGLEIIEGVKIADEPFSVNGMDMNDYHYMLDSLLKDGKYQWYIITKVLAGTGMRIGEAMSVTYGDIRKGCCTVYGKGNKERVVYFSHGLQETLYMYIKDKSDDEKVIPYSINYVRTAYGNIKKRYGLSVNNNPHEYRRFFARQMYESTHDVALVKGLLGHESVNMTNHYIKKTQNQAMTLYVKAQNW